MRQRRWLELIKDYELEIHYYPGKANVVADALSRKSYCSLLTGKELSAELCAEMERLRLDFVTTDIWLRGRLCVPLDEGLKESILTKAHSTRYSIHPGSTKMYQDLKKLF
ncbi:hypothetical protein U9M48_004441 [Paspalum notatum var. saurae]|uniref:Pol protein n=1 Tax=Paspalum notatum var. saurae TaxID=547442 RepID=A0AAQ3PUT1_PASNO